MIDMFWKLTYWDFNIHLVDVYNMKITASLQAFPTLPPPISLPPKHCIDEAYLKLESLR